LLQRSKQAIEKIRVELGDMPTQANEIIIFLNSKTREDLEELKIEDKIETILEVKRVLTKRGIMLQLEKKVQVMEQGVQKFFNKIDALPDYKKRLSNVSKDSSKFSGIQGSITGKAFMDALQLDISIQHEIRYIFLTKPTFTNYTDMDEVSRRLLKVTVSSHLRRKELCDLLD